MNCIRNKFTVFIFVFAFVCLTRSGVPVGAGQATEKPSTSVFVTQQTGNEVFSRELSVAEAEQIHLPKETAESSIVAASRNAPSQSQFRFALTTTAQLDAALQAKAAVQRALTKWAEMFDNDLTVAVRVDFGATLFGNQFPTADTVAVTAVEFYPANYDDLAELLTQRSFSLQQRGLYELFPPEAFRTELNLVSYVRLPAPLGKVTGSIAGGFNNPFTIGFNSNKKYDFDPSDGIDADKLDFEALMLREIGRALGFVSSAGSAEAKHENPANTAFHDLETMWDIFRFRDRISLPEFNFARRAQLSGGKHIFFAGGQELELSTGKPNGQGGDGRPAGHWKDDELTGQYLGIMDPTYAAGERGGITANDLSALDYFGYTVWASTPVIEVLSNDDNSGEENLALNGAMAVTRLMPSRYPCEVQSVRLRLPQAGNIATGQQIRVVVFADPARTGKPPTNPKLLFERMLTIPAVPENRMLELMLPNGVKIESGDLYVGLQATAGLMLAGDANIVRHSSFVSTDNGASFLPLKGAGQQPINLMARAVVTARYGDPVVPEISSFSPNTINPGVEGFTLHVYGRNFYGIEGGGFRENSIVRWNGEDRATEFLSGSLLKATIYASDVASAGTARVTVFSTNELREVTESAPVEFSITTNRPVPVVESLSPSGAQTGGNGFNLLIVGKNFNRESIVRWNGIERAAEVYNSAEISLPVTKADLANSANAEVEVFTPGPGGGASNKSIFTIAPCRYRLSAGDQLLSALINVREVLVTTGNYCRWTAQSDSAWIGLLADKDGLGTGLFRLDVESNFADSGRVGTVSVGDARLSIRQSGFAKSVSAANFTAPIAPESIASVYSLGHGFSTFVANGATLPTNLGGVEVRVRNALGVERTAPLFFVSPEQINFQVPAGISTGTATVFVYLNGSYRNYGAVQIAQFAPGIFTTNSSGSGLASAVALRVKADGSQSYEPVAVFDPVHNRIVARPIDLGSETDRVFLLLFGTGWRGRTALSAFKAKIGGVDAPVAFAGAQGEFTGLDQMNVELPTTLRGRGEVTINCTVDNRPANPVTVTIK
ncbi:MAG: NF038122 family metalloprotease [Acidobacteria bacterium]|nr:NF038122 family metalloprotease [Acidobacteriota bacterium]